MDRLQLQTDLEVLLGSDHVYFQPPSSVKMAYPAIVYKRFDLETKFADNVPYDITWRYEVTYISRDPDSDIPEKLGRLPMSSLVSTFVADNLNHYVFYLYY